MESTPIWACCVADSRIRSWSTLLKVCAPATLASIEGNIIDKHCAAPTALSNGPTILECQTDFVVETIAKLEKEHAKSIEPTRAAEEEWKKLIALHNENTLFPLTSSWWTGGNIPGKKAESLTYTAGIEQYEKQCRETLPEWKGFTVVTA